MDNTTMINTYEIIARHNRRDDWLKFLAEADEEPWCITYEVDECSPPHERASDPAWLEQLFTDVKAWIALKRRAAPASQVMTVGDIRAALAAYPEDMPVLVADGNGWYNYLEALDGPIPGDEDSAYMRPTFAMGRDWDARDS